MDTGSTAPLTGNLALDAQGLTRLKRAAGAQAGSAEQNRAIQESAKQAEALFVTQLLRSMRATRMDSGMLQNPGRDMFEGMLDQQRAQAISARGLGLSNVIARQLQTISQNDAQGAAAAQSAQKDKTWSAPSSTLP